MMGEAGTRVSWDPSTNLRLLQDWVLILPDNADMREGMLYVPDQYRIPPLTGTVVRCGLGRTVDETEEWTMFAPMVLEPGMRIAFEDAAHLEVHYTRAGEDGVTLKTTYLLMRQTSVMAVLG